MTSLVKRRVALSFSVKPSFVKEFALKTIAPAFKKGSEPAGAAPCGLQ